MLVSSQKTYSFNIQKYLFFGSHDIAGSAPGAWGMTINKPKNVSCPCEACSTIHPHGPLFPPPILLPFREGG